MKSKVMHWRKHTENKLPWGKRKQACMVELKGAKGSEGMRRSQRLGQSVEKGVAGEGLSGSLFHHLDEQNSLLDGLVGLKEWEIYGGWLGMDEEETDEDGDVEVGGLEVMELEEVSVEVRKVRAEVGKSWRAPKA